jgi:molybdenum cofactor synthesis domain-containing protein
MKAAVVTCSTRCAAGTREDRSGMLLDDGLREAGCELLPRRVVPDDPDQIRAAVQDAIDAGARIVLTTGGTGISPTDLTPEAILPMLTKHLPGIAEAIRGVSREEVPTSMLSRGVAGCIGNVLVVALPGSTGGARDGLRVLAPVLTHAVEQLDGGDHQPSL